jgi:hypothetical protein
MKKLGQTKLFELAEDHQWSDPRGGHSNSLHNFPPAWNGFEALGDRLAELGGPAATARRMGLGQG